MIALSCVLVNSCKKKLDRFMHCVYFIQVCKSYFFLRHSVDSCYVYFNERLPLVAWIKKEFAIRV